MYTPFGRLPFDQYAHLLKKGRRLGNLTYKCNSEPTKSIQIPDLVLPTPLLDDADETVVYLGDREYLASELAGQLRRGQSQMHVSGYLFHNSNGPRADFEQIFSIIDAYRQPDEASSATASRPIYACVQRLRSRAYSFHF